MKNTTTAFFLIGSNIGDRAENLNRAADFLEKKVGKITRRSSFYETEPWGKSDQNWFFNQAVEVETSLAAVEILEKTKAIEAEMGRAFSEKNGPRIIDIDLLFFGNEHIETPELTVPHPEIQNRNFTAMPPITEPRNPTFSVRCRALASCFETAGRAG